MGDPFDFFLDEGGWPYPDDTDDDDGSRGPEPVDLRSDADDDLVALHALSPQVLADVSEVERAAVVARFGLGGGAPMTMAELRTALGLSRDRTRTVLTGGLDKLRTALASEQRGAGHAPERRGAG
jgi:DNA-directed RNA polymerase sigma subunit (sigma70/sigma32)